MLVTKQILGPILPTNILPNIFLCVQQSKDMYTGLEQLEGEL